MACSKGSAPSPTRPDREPGKSKRARVEKSLEDDVDESDSDNTQEDDDEDDEVTVSRAVERERFSKITKKDMRKAYDAHGKFDVLRYIVASYDLIPYKDPLALHMNV